MRTMTTTRDRNRAERSADPYGDLDVIDARAPRANQAVIGALALLAFMLDWWPLLAILAVQLLVGLRFGRRYCLPCLFYFEAIQPSIGEGPIEDSRPPRFANQVGLVVLSAASLAHLVGLQAVGWGLGLLVSALALFAAFTGFCAGCELYRLGARLRGIYGDGLDTFDPADLGVGSGDKMGVLFTHPLCTDCHDLEKQLTADGSSYVAIDVRDRPDLARKYGITVVPTLVSVGEDGSAAVVPSSN